MNDLQVGGAARGEKPDDYRREAEFLSNSPRPGKDDGRIVATQCLSRGFHALSRPLAACRIALAAEATTTYRSAIDRIETVHQHADNWQGARSAPLPIDVRMSAHFFRRLLLQ